MDDVVNRFAKELADAIAAAVAKQQRDVLTAQIQKAAEQISELSERVRLGNHRAELAEDNQARWMAQVDTLTAQVETLKAYGRHKPTCSLMKPRVLEHRIKSVDLDEQDDIAVTWHDVQIDGPGDTCTCGFAALLEQA